MTNDAQDTAGFSVWSFFRSTKTQLVMSATLSLVVSCYHWLTQNTFHSSPFSGIDAYFAFTFGMATLFAILGPLLFTLLMQQIQACHDERLDLYWRLEESISEFRDAVSGLREDGRIHYRIADRLEVFELLKLDKLNKLSEFHYLFDQVLRLAKWIGSKLAEKGGRPTAEEARLIRLLNDIEERMGLLGTNFIRRIVVTLVRDAAIKCMACVGALIALALFALGFYSSATQSVFFFAIVAISSFGVLVTVELCQIAYQECREIVPEVEESDLPEYSD